MILLKKKNMTFDFLGFFGAQTETLLMKWVASFFLRIQLN